MRRIVALAVTALLFCGMVSLALVSGTRNGQASIEIHKVDEAHFLPVPGQPVFFLVLGVDGRPGIEGDRADAIHLIGINPAAGAGTILNFPRDSFVEIPGRGQSRINDAFFYGGTHLQAETVERLTGIHPSFILTTNFPGLEGMVNDLGGIDVDVPIAMKDKSSGADFPKGRVHMNGAQALAFSRNRHVPDGDLRRSEHQALLILSALTKVRAENPGPAGTLQYLAVLARHVRFNNVALPELYRLARLGLTVDPARMRNVTMPSRLGMAGARSVVFVGAGAPSLFADMRDDAVLQAH
ncbi:MAG TPA: LCP family protein [Acidimicrobiales bacterium]|nr:LCP family protein [Acidimicrobiales bacterium]